MVSAWLLGIMRRLTDQNKYMKSILWAYSVGKISGTEEAEQALKVIETWEGNDAHGQRGKSS